ncbi:MAG: DUF423 domain-containing protein [Thermodesulfobacteriota bacterium]
MNRIFFVTGAIMAGLAVGAGSYGAHAGSSLGMEQRVWIEKAARYQMYHSLALICVSFAITHWSEARLFQVTGWLFLVGIICFSGSLYLMAFTGINPGYTVPAGGMAFIMGWGLMAFAGLFIKPAFKA